MKPDPHHASLVCHNCQAVTSGNFCYSCGQETVLHPASAREFLHEFIGHYVALEGKLWGTLIRLLFQPGSLTIEYIKGRRVRFLQPLRLYLTLSVLFFALLKLTSAIDVPVVEGAPQTGHPPASASAAAPESAAASASIETPASGHAGATAPVHGAPPAADAVDKESDFRIEFGPRVDAWFAYTPHILHQLHAFERMPAAQKSRVLTEGVAHYAPMALFCMMPVFALFLKILYLGSGRRFGEHLLFALHANSFAFIMLGLIVVIDVTPLRIVLWFWLLGYLPWAMKRVYHSGRFGTGWRWLTLMLFYVVALLAGLVLAGATGIVTAH